MKNMNEIGKRLMLMAICLYLISGTLNLFAQNVPDGANNGINYIDNNTVILVLTAPDKGSAYVTGTFNSWGKTTMNKAPDGKMFWVQLNNLTADQEYIYQYVVDGMRIADPYAEKILDPWNDPYISSQTYPGLISYTDVTKGIASVFQTAQPEYNWSVTNFTSPLKHQLVIYELLIRDFTAQHSYQSVIDSMQYLKKLGINAIELMPVNEFDGNNSWGYNPSYYFAPDKYYGPKEKLQQLIDVAHQNGIAVIIDMVYNHTMNSSPLAKLYWNSTLSRPASNNPWYNETAPHTTISWGNDFNHESQYTRDFFDRVNKHWIEEYKIDGFRFDFTKGFTQTYSTSDPSGYDQSRVNNIKRMADKIWLVKKNTYVILEHWSEDAEENALTGYGMLTWRRVDSQYKEAMMGWQLTNNGSNLGASQTDLKVVFMESHDEERQMVFCKNFGNSSGSYNIKATNTALDRMALGAAFLYTVPGPKMIWMFGEQGYDYSINYCTNGTISETCRTGEKPLVWLPYMQDQNRKDLHNAISGLLKLRKENQAFTMGYYEADNDGDALVNAGIGPLRQIRFKHSTMDVVIIGNFGTTGGSIKPWFTKTGTWYNYFGNYTYDYTGQISYYLAPGQWELYTSEPIGTPGPVVSVSIHQTSASIAIGNKLQLVPSVLPTNATNKSVTWSTSNSSVATVSTNGLVTGVSEGAATITVTTVSEGKTANCVVTVTPNTCTYYYIKNRWQSNTYLKDANDGKVTYGTNPSTTNYIYQWSKEDVDATYFRLKNRATGLYMNNENLLDYVQSTTIQNTWWSAMWREEDAGNGWIRFRNKYKPSDMLHIENLKGYAQRTGAQISWWSAMWQLESATSLKMAENEDDFVNIAADVNFYPNPVVSGETLNISLTGIPEDAKLTMTLYNLTGNIIMKNEINSFCHVELNIPQGVYIVSIQTKDISINKSLIVK